jgi:hypothetical protein
MRITALLGGLGVTFILAGVSSAQTTPYSAVVTQPEAEVRCKPGATPAVYATNLLKRGDFVVVVQDRQDGWLGVAPPAGSFSWIDTRYVRKVIATQMNWMVIVDPRTKVPVVIGSELQRNDIRPNVEGAYLERGAQVRSIGPAKQDSDGSWWLPIEPPAGEVRYIRAEAVNKAAALQTAAATDPTPRAPTTPLVQATPVSYSTFVPAAATTSTPAVVPAATAPPSLWNRAQQAESAGRITEAIAIFRQLYRDNVNTDRAAAEWANNRANFLENGQRSPAPAVSPIVAQTPAVNTYATYQPLGKYVPLRTEDSSQAGQAVSPGGFANPVSGDKSSAQLAGRVDALPDDRLPSARLNPPAIDAPPAATGTTNRSLTPGLAGNPQVFRSGPGKLVRAGVQIGAVPTYRLISANNVTLYVTAVPGIDLERFVDQNVELIGTAMYHGQLRANHMQVQDVQILPPTP